MEKTACRWKENLLQYLPMRIRIAAQRLPDTACVEELRFRRDAPVFARVSGEEYPLMLAGGASVTAEEMRELFDRFTEQSRYAREREIAEGFLTLAGGYRVGIAGRMRDGILTEVTGFSLRIARQVPGAADAAIPYLKDADGRLMPTLVFSPPGCGKTTFLRELARSVSDGRAGLRAASVSLVDERCELTGGGLLCVGLRTDTLTGVDRTEGMRRMCLTMSPEVLITDELRSEDDALAVLDAAACGITVAASAHAPDIGTLFRRRCLLPLTRAEVFERYVRLGRSHGVGTVEMIHDARGNEITGRETPCFIRLP